MVETLEDKVLELERQVQASFLHPEIGRISQMRRQAIRFQRVLGPMGEVAGKLSHLELPRVADNASMYMTTSGVSCAPDCPSARSPAANTHRCIPHRWCSS
jgi:Mg2+ and Co2+ transporter CorA